MAEGWAAVKLPDVCAINPPKPPVDLLPPDTPVTFVPMPAVDADRGVIATPTTRPFVEVRRGFTAFRDDDVIMAKITPCMENGKAAIARDLQNGLGFGSTEFHVFRSNGAVRPEYLFHYIRQESFRTAAEAEMTGSVGQKRVPVSFLEETDLPLAPLAEQERIAAKVEVLLSRVNAARERLARVPAILKRFRQSILAAACSGRLTEDWRKKRGVDGGVRETHERPQVPRSMISITDEDEVPDLPNGWLWVRAGNTYLDAGYGTSVKCGRAIKGGVPVLRVPNIASGRLECSDLKYAPRQAIAKPSLILERGDLVICRTNGSLDLIGKAAIVPSLDSIYSFASYLIRIRVDPNRLLPEYFHIFLTSPLGRDRIEKRARTTAGQFNLNLEILRGLSLPLPPIEEQHKIMRSAAKLVALADVIESHCASGAIRAEKLTQAVLAKAFRGELVLTEAELARAERRPYEPASVLLARILCTQTAAQPTARRTIGRSGTHGRTSRAK